MSLTLDTTLAGKDSNSYVDLDFANSYWDGHYNTTKSTAWDALVDQQKITLLINATRIVDTARFVVKTPYSEYELHYDPKTHLILDITLNTEPSKYYYWQKLQFPRNLDIDPTTSALYMPLPVQMATCEQAVYLLTFDEAAMSARNQGIVSDTLSVGKGQLHTSQQYSSQGSMYAPVAMEMLRPFFISGSKMRRG